MLETRIDEQVLREIPGIKFEKMAYPGSGSASWWLILKNYIAPQSYPPRTIVIFFRNMQLTLADYHTQGRFRPRLEALMSDNGEPFLEEILRSTRKEESGRLLSLVQRLYPLQKHQSEWQEKIYQASSFRRSPSNARWFESNPTVFSAPRVCARTLAPMRRATTT